MNTTTQPRKVRGKMQNTRDPSVNMALNGKKNSQNDSLSETIVKRIRT